MKSYEITLTQTISITVEDEDVDISEVIDKANKMVKKENVSPAEALVASCSELDCAVELSNPYDTEFELMW